MNNTNDDVMSPHDHLKNTAGKWVFRVWVVFIILLLIWGKYISQFDYTFARYGLGYAMGIMGVTMIVLQLAYSARKRIKIFRNVWTVKAWFRLHMFFGIAGPVLILFHGNFRFGSPNSTVALLSMLIVSGSGLIGRFLYNKIHYSLYGEKIKLSQLHEDFVSLNKEIDSYIVTEKQQLAKEKYLKTIEQMFETQSSTTSFRQLFSQWKQARKNFIFIKKFLGHLEKYHQESHNSDNDFATTHKQLHTNVDSLMRIVKALPTLELCERLFALWHVVHLPIFALMLVTATIHIVVVHMY